MSALAVTAVACAQRGVHVLPLAPAGKAPLATLVPRGLRDATCDPATVAAWWREQPRANLGLVPGAGRVVLDLDGADGAEALRALERDHAPLPATACARTGRGRHLWLRSPIDVRSSAGRLGPGIDVRAGVTGYVVAPPSIHPSGRRYEWSRSQRGLAVAPDWLLRLLTHSRPAAHAVEPLAAGDRRRLEAVAAGRLRVELDRLGRQSREPGTGRGTALWTAAAHVGECVGVGVLDAGTAVAALTLAGDGLALDAIERDRSIERGLAHGAQHPLRIADLPPAPRARGRTGARTGARGSAGIPGTPVPTAVSRNTSTYVSAGAPTTVETAVGTGHPTNTGVPAHTADPRAHAREAAAS